MTPYVSHPGAQSRCSTCSGRGYVVRPRGEYAAAVLCECVGRCPSCQDTGWVSANDDPRGPKTRCTCQLVHRRRHLFDQAHIPARHAESTLSSFQIQGPSHQIAIAAAMGFLQNFRPDAPSRGLILYGEVGRGKTHLLCAIVRELVLEHGVSARFTEFSHLVADLKVAFERGAGAADVLSQNVSVDVLAIDELGKGRNTEFEGTVVDEVVSRRYNANTTMLGTTNYEPGPSTGHVTANLSRPGNTRPRLVDRLGDRVYSRIEDMCDFVAVQGEDFRLRGRNRR